VRIWVWLKKKASIHLLCHQFISAIRYQIIVFNFVRVYSCILPAVF
jgi:hypothetical protein